MAKAGMQGAIGVGVVALAVVVAMQLVVLPDAYRSTPAGTLGVLAVLLGIILTTVTLLRAITASQGSAGVVRIAGPTAPLVYTLASAGAWLAAPLLVDTLAYALHILLVAGVAFSMIALGALTGHAQASDEASEQASAGRDAMLSSVQAAQRKLTNESPETVRRALHAVVETITYADRQGHAETVALEGAIVTALDQLSLMPADEAQDTKHLSAIERQLAERRDTLKAHK